MRALALIPVGIVGNTELRHLPLPPSRPPYLTTRAIIGQGCSPALLPTFLCKLFKIQYSAQPVQLVIAKDIKPDAASNSFVMNILYLTPLR